MSISPTSINYIRLKDEIQKLKPNTIIKIFFDDGQVKEVLFLAENTDEQTAFYQSDDNTVNKISLNNLKSSKIIKIEIISEPETILEGDDGDEDIDDDYMDKGITVEGEGEGEGEDDMDKGITVEREGEGEDDMDKGITVEREGEGEGEDDMDKGITVEGEGEDEDEYLISHGKIEDDIFTIDEEGTIRGEREIERQLSQWDIHWSDEELIEALTYNLIDIDSNRFLSDAKKYELNHIKAENILEHIYQISEKLEKNHSKILYGNNYKPILNEILNNNFTNNLFKPIVYDNKKIYTDNSELLEDKEGDDDIQEFPQVKFINPNEDILLLKSLYVKYTRHKSSNKLHGSIDYNEYRKSLAGYGNLNLEKIDGIEDVHNVEGTTTEKNVFYNNISGGYINEESLSNISGNLEFYKTDNLLLGDNVIRMCYPDHNCYSIKNDSVPNTPLTVFEERYANGNEYIFEDQLSNRSISERRINKSIIKTCNGTNKTGDSFYANTSIKKYANSDFNKSILVPPKKEILVNGEKINIVGIYIKSIEEYVPNFINRNYYNNTRVLNNFNSNHNNGYNLNDYFNITIPKINHDSLLVSNISTFSNLDINKNNFILFQNDIKQFNKLSDIKFKSYLNTIIPSIKDISKIEKYSLNQCDNFKDIDKVFTKYHISSYEINKVNRQTMELKKLFIERANQYDKNNQYNINLKKIYLEDYKNLKNLIEEIHTLKNNIPNKKNCYHINLHDFIKSLINIISKSIYTTKEKFYTENQLERFLSLLNRRTEYSDSIKNKKFYLIKLITHIIITKSIYNIPNYNNSVLNYFSNSSDDANRFNLDQNVKKYLQINNIKLLNNKGKFYNNTKLNNNDLKVINFYSNIYNKPDSNNFIHTYLRFKDLKNFKDTVQLEINNNYIKDICQEYNPDWKSLSYREKKEYLLNKDLLENIKINLDTHKTLFNTEKEKYQFYLERCEGFRIVKIYHSKKDLKNDDYHTQIFYDKIFDNSKINFEIVNKFLISNQIDIQITDPADSSIKNLILQNLSEYYPLDSKKEIISKYQNFLKNITAKTKKRLIDNGEYALLIHNGSRFLYKRDNNIWVILGKSEVLSKTQCILELNEVKYLSNISFENLISDIDIEKIPEDTIKLIKEDYKCVKINDEIYNSKCIPRILIPYLIKVTILKKNLLYLSTFIGKLENMDTDYDKLSQKIEEILTIYSKYQNISTIKDRSNIISIDSKIPKEYRSQFLKIVSLPDIDERLSKLKEMIEKYGKFNINDTGEITGYIKWNVTNSDEIMCCSHYLPICDMAWKNSSLKEEILEKVSNKYSGPEEDGIIFCRICGEALDDSTKSHFEGWDQHDKPIIFREKDIIQEDELYFYDKEEEIYIILRHITQRLGINLSNEDIIFIVKNSNLEINKLFNKTEFYLSKDPLHGQGTELNNFITKLTKTLKKVGQDDRYLQAVKKGADEFFNRHNKITLLNIHETSTSQNQKLFLSYIKHNKFRNNYEKYIFNSTIAIILNYFIIIIQTATPDYIFKGIGDERKTKTTTFLGNLWEDFGIEYLINIINSFRKNTSIFSKFLAINKTDQKKIFMDNYFDKYRTLINSYYNIKQKIINKDLFLQQQDQQIDLEISSYTKWSEFRPSLLLNSDISSLNVVTINDSMDEYIKNYKRYQNLMLLLSSKNHQITENEINLVYQSLINSEKKLHNISKILGEDLIIKLNKYLVKIKKGNFIANNQSYTSFCDPQKIYLEYLDNVLSNSDFKEHYTLLNKLEKFIKNNIKTNLDKNILSFKEINTALEKTTSWEKGRQFLHYMYIDEELFYENNDRYKKYLINKILQINLIVITNIVPIPGSNTDNGLGEKRFFKKIIDKDGIYTINKDKNQLIQLLKDKYNNEISDEYIKKKVHNLINLNKIYSSNNNTDNDEDDLYLELDMISGLYKYEIKDKINTHISDKTINELKKEIENLETFLKSNNIILLNNESHSNIDKSFNTELKNIQIIEKCLQQAPFNLFTYNELSTFSRDFISKKQELNNISEISKTESKIRKFFNDNLKPLNDSNYKKIDEYLQAKKIILPGDKNARLFYEELGKNTGYLENSEKKLDNILKIENYKDKDEQNEKEFRKRELFKRNENGQRIINLKQYIISLLNICNSFSKKVIHKKTYNDTINKYDTIIDSLGTDYKLIYMEKYIAEFDNIDNVLHNIFQKEQGERDDLLILGIINTISENSENINNLLNNLYTNSNEYSCQKIERINIMLPEYIISLLHYILSTILYQIVSIDSDIDILNYEIVKTILSQFHNNVQNNENLTNILDEDIVKAIEQYKYKNNMARRKRFSDLSPELQGVQQLFRKFNLGDKFGGYEDDIDTPIGLQDLSIDQIDQQIENDELQMGDGEDTIDEL
jgi:hypothetical protein